MTIRPVNLNATAGGMTRLREKGGASPDTLFELMNGYINASKAAKQRPGTRWINALPDKTKGLCAYKSKLHVFSAKPFSGTPTGGPLFSYTVLIISPTLLSLVTSNSAGTAGITAGDMVTVSASSGPLAPVNGMSLVCFSSDNGSGPNIALTMPSALVALGSGVTVSGAAIIGPTSGGEAIPPGDYVINVLRHPDPDNDDEIKTIHFSAPYLGYLYVVAEFDGGDIFHYWLREPATWQPTHAYLGSDSVQPTAPNGYYYQASTELTPPAWAPGVARAVGDVIQPTVATGWKYTCTAVSGAAPISGGTEPTWPQVDGATVTEYAEAAPPADPGAAPPSNPTDPTGGRYDGPAGGGTAGGSGRSSERPRVREF